MQLDVEELTQFYATPLGQTVRRLLTHRILARWRGLQRSTLIGLGHASPYLGAFRSEAQRVGALMPDSQGVVRWPREGLNNTVLVEENRLPLRDGSVDRLLVVHCLEVAENTRHLLREMWRVLAPEGRIILIVPNRRGVWARLDNTPFGQGRPYSRRQLEQLLLGAMFSPLDWGGALYFPPLGREMLLRSSTAWERVGASISPAFCGVLIVEASKELVAPIGKPMRVRTLRAPILQTQPTSRSVIKRDQKSR